MAGLRHTILLVLVLLAASALLCTPAGAQKWQEKDEQQDHQQQKDDTQQKWQDKDEQQDQECVPLPMTIMARSGNKYGGGVWGALTDSKKQTLVQQLDSSDFRKPLSSDQVSARARGAFDKDADLADVYSNFPDMPVFLEVANKTFMINQFESNPSTAYLAVLAADRNGNLRIVNTAPVDDTDSKVQGLWTMGRGEKTPWGTYLSGEEDPQDCCVYEEMFLPCTNATGYCGFEKHGEGVLQFARYFGYYPGAEKQGQEGASLSGDNLKQFKKQFSCYNYGASPEISVTSASGVTGVTKWRTLGRVSHETAVVMPDMRTVYITSDGSAQVLLMFKANKTKDLSAGTLYAAKFTSKGQVDGKDTFNIDWVKLGTGTQAELEALAVDPETRFSDMFEMADLTSDGKCPQGFSATNPSAPAFNKQVNGKSAYVQCLKIKAGKEDAAAFLESQRVAAIKGATTEFEKLEGFTYNPETNTAYVAISRVDNAMLEDDAMDGLGPDHFQLAPNPCGMIMSLKLDDSYKAASAQVLLAGSDKSDTDALNKCDINNIAGPDDVYYTNGNLLIAEDTPLHFNNYLWAYNLNTGNLSRILSAPTGGQVSGPSIQWSGGRAYLTWTVLHPLNAEGNKQPRDAQEEEAFRGYMGYLGPLPGAVASAPGGWDFAPGALAAPASGDEKLRVLAASKVCTQA